MISFLLDDNLPPQLITDLKALAPAGEAGVFGLARASGRNVRDEDWVPEWGKKGAVYIAPDHRTGKRKTQLALLLRHGLSVFIVRVPPGSRHDDIGKLVAFYWMEMLAAAREAGSPFAYEITARSGLRKLAL